MYPSLQEWSGSAIRWLQQLQQHSWKDLTTQTLLRPLCEVFALWDEHTAFMLQTAFSLHCGHQNTKTCLENMAWTNHLSSHMPEVDRNYLTTFWGDDLKFTCYTVSSQLVILLQNYNVISLFLLTNILNATAAIPILLGLWRGPLAQKIITPASALFGCLLAIAAVVVYGILQAPHWGISQALALHRVFLGKVFANPSMLILMTLWNMSY